LYSKFSTVLFKNLEFFAFKQGLSKTFSVRAPSRRDVVHTVRASLLGVRARGRTAQGSPPFQAELLPQAPRPEVWESSRPRARHGPRRTGRCAPRTAGPSVAHRRTRAGRDGRATAASPASRRRHREVSAIKARAPSAFARPTDPPAAIAAATVCSRLL
jgi:hypothetical protein